MSGSERTYDIVLFGATGHTGKYTAEHIASCFPTDLKWALAGRSQSKLEAISQELKKLNRDRKPPGKSRVTLPSNNSPKNGSGLERTGIIDNCSD